MCIISNNSRQVDSQTDDLHCHKCCGTMHCPIFTAGGEYPGYFSGKYKKPTRKLEAQEQCSIHLQSTTIKSLPPPLSQDQQKMLMQNQLLQAKFLLVVQQVPLGAKSAQFSYKKQAIIMNIKFKMGTPLLPTPNFNLLLMPLTTL